MLTTFHLISAWGTTGLVGTLGVTVKDTSGNQLIARSTTGFTDLGSGNYLVEIPNWNVSWTSVIEIDNGVTTRSILTGLDIETSNNISLSNIDEADAYFATRLGGASWIAISDHNQKQLGLNDATRILNRFVYIGWKTLITQTNQWPRSGISCLPNGITPNDIYAAQYEIAYSLLVDEIDIQKELRNANVLSRRFAGVATTYSNDPLPEYLLWGVPSWLAWTLLLPYLDLGRSESIRLDRVT